MPVGEVLQVLDVRGAAPGPVPAGVGLLLAGSAAAFGAWAGRGVPVAVVPPVVAVRAAASGGFGALHILPGRGTEGLARAAAGWARLRRKACGVEGGLALVGELGAAPLMARGAALLDLRSGSERVGAPGPVLDALSQGMAVLFVEADPLADELVRSGAGLLLEAVEAGLEAFAGLAEERRLAMSAAALAYVGERHSAAAAAAALQRAVRPAAAAWLRRARDWPAHGPGGHVLVLSDEALNLRDIRVHLPFDALLRRGAIGGYSVLRHGEFVFTTAPVGPELVFTAIWVQRSVDPLVLLLLRALGCPYIYDLDDHLLVSPSYRPAFPAESIATARALVRGCAVLSCATERLACALGEAGKSVVTPNLADGAATTIAGAAGIVVWASSDRPALTGSGAEVVRAVRDFCRAHGLGVLCIGAAPAEALTAAGLDVEHVGLLSYAAYLARLRAAAPGILVGPLETGADRSTQDFVDAKSDVKVIEARRAGLVGVFSRAAAYAESDLGPLILCDNTYESWLDGLERARRECLDPAPTVPWPGRRDVGQTGPMPWAEALRRAGTTLPAADVVAAAAFVRTQGETLLTGPEGFDEADYLGRHEDVAQAVTAGVVASGYRHYVQSGFREGRLARRLETAGDGRALWWAWLLRVVDRVEAAVERRGDEIEALAARMALRRALPDPAPAPAAAVEVAAPGPQAVRWAPGGALAEACPVCDAPGPHGALLESEGLRLARCGSCRCCFYAERIAYHYEAAAAAALLLQFSLEQNAGVYHQTRLLFAVEHSGSVLDVGCGFGFAVGAAAALGWRACGIDPSPAAGSGAALLGADIRQSYLTDETELGAAFGLVLASEVIEHVPQPSAFLGLLRRALEPGGTLVLTTPDADALRPGLDAASLTGILALRVHLVLFSREGLSLALQRAGFRHVRVEAQGDGLTAYASDRPLRMRGDAEAAHLAAYRGLLEGFLESQAAGSALWNGAAGRLLALLAPAAPLEALHALFVRIAAAWRERFGFDLLRGWSEERPALDAGALAAGQPLNLAVVLLGRAVLEDRTPGRTPEAVLLWARPALREAVRTAELLRAENLIDLDLQRVAAEARLLIGDRLGELAPELQGEVLLGLAAGADEVGVAVRIAGAFADRVQADQFAAARMLAPWMGDFDRLGGLLAGSPGLLLRSLFTVGVLRLIDAGDARGALAAFTRLEREAGRLRGDPRQRSLARDFLRLAQEHKRLAATRLLGESSPT